jgi:hypothetical protein
MHEQQVQSKAAGYDEATLRVHGGVGCLLWCRFYGITLTKKYVSLSRNRRTFPFRQKLPVNHTDRRAAATEMAFWSSQFQVLMMVFMIKAPALLSEH